MKAATIQPLTDAQEIISAREVFEVQWEAAPHSPQRKDRSPTLAEVKARIAAGSATALERAEANTLKLIGRPRI